MRHLMRGGQEVIHKAASKELALFVINELLKEARANSVSDAPEGHSFYDVRIDYGAAIVAKNVAAKFGLAYDGIQREQNEMAFERISWIHLCPATFRQFAPARHLHHVFRVKTWSYPRRKRMMVSVRDVDDFSPLEAIARSIV